MQKSHPVLVAALAGIVGALISSAMYLLFTGAPVDASTGGLFIGIAVVLAFIAYRQGRDRPA